jgi:hypothetical protein
MNEIQALSLALVGLGVFGLLVGSLCYPDCFISAAWIYGVCFGIGTVPVIEYYKKSKKEVC